MSVPFAEWRPDMPDLAQWAREALNVVSAEESYRPFQVLASFSSALVARAQGAAWFRGTAGATKMLAGDAAKLYLLSNTTWNNATRLEAAKNITAINKSAAAGISVTAHGYVQGDVVFITGVLGMTQINGLYGTVLTIVDANNFTVNINSTGFSTYSSAGTTQKILNYAPGGDGTWRFTQFGALAIAVNGIDSPQKFDLGSATNFTALGGSPPIGTFVTTVKDFVLMGKIGATPQRVQWSGINNCELWGSVPANQADFQDLPDGGNVTGLAGGELGLILQESALRRMTYEGSPTVFRIDKIANELGASIPNSVASVEHRVFFLHKSGFFMVEGGQTITPIGRGKVDRTFWKEFDETNHFRSSAAIDPVRGLYIFAYPAAGNAGTPNRLMIYNWVTQRWTHAQVTCEIVFGGVSQQSVTLEGLDPYGTLDGLPFSLDSSYWTGAVSLLLFGFDTAHKSGSFSGLSLAATLETAEFNPGNGRRSVIRGCRPLIDGGAPSISLGYRETQQATVAYGGAVGLTAAGQAPVYQSGRYFRARATIPAGDNTWSNAMGIDDLDVRPAGQQ